LRKIAKSSYLQPPSTVPLNASNLEATRSLLRKSQVPNVEVMESPYSETVDIEETFTGKDNTQSILKLSLMQKIAKPNILKKKPKKSDPSLISLEQNSNSDLQPTSEKATIGMQLYY